MTADLTRPPGRRSFIRVACDACGRSAVSDTLSAAELCRLISWEYDGVVTTCVQCQWMRGERPSFVDRYGGDRPSEPRSWMERFADAGEWWQGGSGRET